MNNTSARLLISGMTTAAFAGYMQTDVLAISDYLTDTSTAQIECCIPAETIPDPYYEAIARQIREKIAAENIDFLLSTNNFEADIRNWFSIQAASASEDFKKRINELLKALLSLEEIDNARLLLQLTDNYFPEDQDFSLARNIIAPPKIISSNTSATEGIHDTIQFFKKLGKNFERKWVAVSMGQLLGVSDSYKTLAEKYNDKNVFISKVA